MEYPRLPYPVPSNPNGLARETFESKVEEKVAIKYSGPSLPVNPHIDYHIQAVPASPDYSLITFHDMERKPSISSTSASSVSSTRSTYTPSRSVSPANATYREATVCRRSYSPATSTHIDRHHPYSTPSSPQDTLHVCKPCYERQVKVWIHAGQPCPQCGCGAPSNSTKGKVNKRKVADRHMFAEASVKLANGDTPTKDKKEAGSRFRQGVAISRQQNVLLAKNPNLPHTAAPGKGHEQGGLKTLKPNNKSPDILEKAGVDYLRFNKVDVMDTGTLVIEQLADCLDIALHELNALLAENINHSQCGLNQDELAVVLSCISQLTVYMKHVREHCGELSASQGPSQLQSSVWREKELH